MCNSREDIKNDDIIGAGTAEAFREWADTALRNGSRIPCDADYHRDRAVGRTKEALRYLDNVNAGDDTAWVNFSNAIIRATTHDRISKAKRGIAPMGPMNG